MAVFDAVKALDTTAKDFDTSTPVFKVADGDLIVATYKQHYTNYYGDFKYANNALVGVRVDSYEQFSNNGDTAYVFQSYEFEDYDPVKLFSKSEESAEKYYKYLFSNSDTIRGSDEKDSINAHKGDDFVFGEKGKDKLWGDKGNDSIFGGPGTDKEWGGKGKDVFYFNEGYDKDVIKDFNKKKDKIVIDTDLAGNLSEVEKKAKQKGDDVEIKLKGNKLVIENYDVDKIHKIKLFFTDDELL